MRLTRVGARTRAKTEADMVGSSPAQRCALRDTHAHYCVSVCVHVALPRVTQTCVAHHDRPPNRTENWSYVLLNRGEGGTEKQSWERGREGNILK